MRQQSGILGILAIMVVFFAGYSTVNADSHLQGSQPLDGKIILFAINNGEHNPFDTQPEGASRLASLLTRNGAEVGTVNWATPIPSDTDLVILAGATANYSGDRVARLWSYLASGGNMLLMIDPPIEPRSVQESNALFSLLWSDFGIRTVNSIVINPRQDALPQASAERVNAQGTPIATPTAIAHTIPPQFINEMNSNSEEHPILQDVQIENLVFDGLRPLQMQNFVPSATVIELLVTDEQPYGESDVATFNETGIYQFDEASDQNRRRFVAAVASENTATEGRIVVIGDGNIAQNDFGFGTSPPTSEAFIYADTVRFVLNTTFWLLDQDAPEFSSPAPAPTATRTITPSPSATSTLLEPNVPGVSTGQPTIAIPLPSIESTASPG